MPERTQNIISSDVEIKGTVTFEGELIADGKIEGEILSSGALTVGYNGTILGDIYAGNVAIYGHVKGNVTAEYRCELMADSELVGDLKSPRAIIEDGAAFVGKSMVTQAVEKAQPAELQAEKKETA
ncbi:MAG: polymer-forming cytoskeletal protein [Verrucomicrobiaceae bacterium]|nr:MAG: polymer-forming cytoskeletal protein [Verrucomicrobiaceae bacterium]